MLSSGSCRSLLSVFQMVGPIIANARWPYVSSCVLGTTSRRRLTERSAVVRRLGQPAYTARTGSPGRDCEDTVIQSLNVTRSATSSQCSSDWRSCLRPRGHFFVPLTTRTAAFMTRCNLSVIVVFITIFIRLTAWQVGILEKSVIQFSLLVILKYSSDNE